MRDTGADIDIAWVPAIEDAAGSLARALPEGAPEPLPLVPSSLRPDDAAVAAIRAALRDRGRRTTAITPRPAAAMLARRGSAGWHAARIDGARWRLDARLVGAQWVAIVAIDAGTRTGPFALDLPARFLHPADRLRLAARGDRHRALADIAAIAPPTAFLALTPVDGGWLSVTTRDPIAAELWALGLAERYHPPDLEMQGLWEDATVQRATELELGIRIPSDLRVTVRIAPGATVARSLLFSTAERLGLSLDTGQATG